jgi:hypothetical protein
MAGDYVVDSKFLRLMFENGTIRSAKVEPYPMSDDSWVLTVVTNNGEERQLTKIQSNETKIYRTLGAAVSDIRKIGFKQVELHL